MKRPEFNPLHDDYWIADLEDGSYLEYASTKQFEELFDYVDYLENQPAWRLLGEAKVEIKELTLKNLDQLQDLTVEVMLVITLNEEIKELKELLSYCSNYEHLNGEENRERIKQALK